MFSVLCLLANRQLFFMIDKLRNINTNLALKLVESIEQCFDSRRNVYSHVMMFLSTGQLCKLKDQELYKIKLKE